MCVAFIGHSHAVVTRKYRCRFGVVDRAVSARVPVREHAVCAGIVFLNCRRARKGISGTVVGLFGRCDARDHRGRLIDDRQRERLLRRRCIFIIGRAARIHRRRIDVYNNRPLVRRGSISVAVSGN
ncbi:hypothetical protein SDC9_146691 [bioreactor metagenome]|uniref:Uncharacterized protein n=1 Tax=bioreactor metagenome TaxID=1076179 RepID=A0A645EDT1_9ZZZZ